MYRRIARCLVVVGPASLMAAAHAGCGLTSVGAQTEPPPLQIVEAQGIVESQSGSRRKRLGLRSPAKRIFTTFGTPRGESESLQIGPSYLPASRPAISFPGFDVMVGNSAGNSDIVTAFVVYEGGVTSKGVSVGDPMAKARRRYSLRCTPEYTVEHTTRGECDGRLAAGIYIAFVADFSSDDIGAIAVSSEPFHGGCEDGGAVRGIRLRKCLEEARRGPR